MKEKYKKTIKLGYKWLKYIYVYSWKLYVWYWFYKLIFIIDSDFEDWLLFFFASAGMEFFILDQKNVDFEDFNQKIVNQNK